jgi:L-ascorbate metabolism protein UlaG (beta-lactamase superfamily)
MSRRGVAVALLCAACSGGGSAPDAAPADAGDSGASVVLTWMGVTTWLLQHEDTAVLLDAYTSREPWGELGGNPAGATLIDELLEDSQVAELDAALFGHAHFDHSFDAGAAAARGAQLYGSATLCHLATAQGVEAAGCTVVADGDELTVGSLRVRAVRLPHSFPASIGQFEELDAPPSPPLDETSVPVGATLAYHIEVAAEPEVSLLFYGSFAPLDADDGSGVDFGAALAAAYPAGTRARAWLAAMLPGVAGSVVTEEQVGAYMVELQPMVLIAHHFDDLAADPRAGLSEPFTAPDGWAGGAAIHGAAVRAPREYFERMQLDAFGVRYLDDSPLQDRYGL